MDAITPPDDPARHQIGGNQGPPLDGAPPPAAPPEAEQSPLDTLMTAAAELIELGNRWETERPTITDAEMAAKAGSFRGKLKVVRDGLDELRLEEKRDFEAWLKEKFGPTLDMLARARTSIVGKIDAWLKAEQRRLDEERRAHEAEAQRQREAAEAARRAAEEAAKREGAAALQAQQAAEEQQRRADEAARRAAEPMRAQIKSVTGGRTIAPRTTWHAKIVDEAKALESYRDHPVVRQAALDAALRLADAEAKASKRTDAAKAGFEFYSDTKAA